MEESMQPSAPESPTPFAAAAVLRLLVRNHPGVMSHVCGLFARRAFNVEGILCVPVEDWARSAILLAVNEDERLDQMIRQLRKLEDVIEIRRAPEAGDAFARVAAWLYGACGSPASLADLHSLFAKYLGHIDGGVDVELDLVPVI